jgi:hypothetical protein
MVSGRTLANSVSSKIGGGGYGQNLAMWGSSEDPESFGAAASVARAASNGWYNGEVNLFPTSDYGKDSPNMANFKEWGHFTQLVWRETKKVGCHSHFCPPGTMSGLGSWYTVCNYSPAGMFFSSCVQYASSFANTCLQATWVARTPTTSSLPRARPSLRLPKQKLTPAVISRRDRPDLQSSTAAAV